MRACVCVTVCVTTQGHTRRDRGSVAARDLFLSLSFSSLSLCPLPPPFRRTQPYHKQQNRPQRTPRPSKRGRKEERGQESVTDPRSRLHPGLRHPGMQAVALSFSAFLLLSSVALLFCVRVCTSARAALIMIPRWRRRLFFRRFWTKRGEQMSI